MRLKLTLNRPGTRPHGDILVTVDTAVTVGELAASIARCDPHGSELTREPELTLRIDDDSAGAALPAGAPVGDAGLRSGHSVSVVRAGGRFGGEKQGEVPVAMLVVESGVDAGKQFPLHEGSNHIGRGRSNEVVLTDRMVSKTHARVNIGIGEVIEIIDLASSNGLFVGGDQVPRALLSQDDRVQLGDTVCRVVPRARTPRLSAIATYDFNRSPRLDPHYEGEVFAAPEIPRRFQPARMPVIPLIAPVLLGCLMFAITTNPLTVLFVAMSPLMMLGNVVENRVFGKRDQQKALAVYGDALARLRSRLDEAAREEAATRRAEHPSTETLTTAARSRGRELWSYQPDQRGFLEVRTGLSSRPSRSSVEMPSRGDPAPGTWEALLEVCEGGRCVPDVPVPAALAECGSMGFAGPRSPVLAHVRAIVAQLVTLHSPSEVVLAAVLTSAAAEHWDWLKWLPHTSSDHSPLDLDHLAATPGAALRLVSAIEEVVDMRDGGRSPDAARSLPALVVLVEDEAPIERSRLVDLAERGRALGVHLLWIAPSLGEVPAPCRTFVDVDPSRPTHGSVGYVATGEAVDGVQLEMLDKESALVLARSLAPVVDAGARVDDDSDLPRTVSLLGLTGSEVADSGEAVVDRWRTTNSLPADFVGERRSKDNSLRALAGQAAGLPMVLDLREHGPHALVGGTTGSGKSEFLQSWIMGMALEHSPARVTFLFVDYKGGSAFGECVRLPHSVGLVTDLSPHLVRRALASLKAELRHREHVLQAKKAKDLLELERRGDPQAPPSLVIVVDEFAALVGEVPEFVDGVIDVAQRGRSLGLHLILATQRPAGVIKDNLRANTNLRVALRMADVADSDDVVGSPQAAHFDPGIPGRGIAKTGPGRLTPFQAAYVGGWTSAEPPPSTIVIEDFRIGEGGQWEEPEGSADPPAPTGPNDLHRLVESISSANELVGLEPPRRPWLDELAPAYDLARMPITRSDADLVFGILDDPDAQQQVPVSFVPDRDGNMAVLGTGGSGKSTFLRTLAVVAGLGMRGGPCHVYGLDFGTRGLQMLEVLPHVGSIISGDDHERVQRLLQRLRETLDDRAARYASVNAASISDYRSATGDDAEARILLLVDNLAAFRQAYEVGANSRLFDMFQAIAADGRPVGIHVVVSADRTGAVPSALGSVIQQRLVLRMASEQELMMVGLPTDVFSAETPPGRGFLGDREVQVAVLGGSANTSRQADDLAKLADDLAAVGRVPAAAIERLPEQVRLGDLPPVAGDLPTLGIADEALAPIGFVPEDVLLVVGPPGSERASVLATLALSLRRCGADGLVYLGPGKSELRSLVPWAREATGIAEIADAARELTAAIGDGQLPRAMFLEDLSSYNNSEAETPLVELLKATRSAGVLVVTEAEAGSIAAWPLHQAVKGARHGIALQPDQFDGENIFKTPLPPRINRADFPEGRGFYIRAGQARRVQCALPEL